MQIDLSATDVYLWLLGGIYCCHHYLGREFITSYHSLSIGDYESGELIDADIRAVLGFSPVNYYATKDRYLLCTFWYTDDLSEIYMRFELRVDDLPHGHTKMYQIDKVLMRDILRKFGQNINIGE